MKYIKAIIYSFILLSTIVQAEESSLDKAKNGAEELWGNTKDTTIQIADSASEKASEYGEKASDLGSKVAKNAKDTGAVVWDKMKEAGTATADSARKGASKIRSLVGQEDCKEDSSSCNNPKE